MMPYSQHPEKQEYIVQEPRLKQRAKLICFCNKKLKPKTKIDAKLDEFIYGYLKSNYTRLAEKMNVSRQCMQRKRKNGFNIKDFEKILNLYNMDYEIFIKPKTEEKKNDL